MSRAIHSRDGVASRDRPMRAGFVRREGGHRTGDGAASRDRPMRGPTAVSGARAFVLALIAVAVVGCAPRGESADSSRAPALGGESLAGVVRIVGSAPMNVQLVLEPVSSGPVRLVGPFVEELTQLAGAVVAVRGAVTASPDPLVSRQVEVAGYEIVSINGRPVVFGEVIAVEGGQARIRTADGSVFSLTGAPASFAVGQKVWVQGVQSVAVQAYGTVRP